VNSRYAQAMMSLEFSPAQVANIERNVVAALGAADTPGRDHAGLARAPLTRQPAPKPSLGRVVVMAAAILALLGLGGLAVAAGSGRIDIPAAFEAIFDVPSEQVKQDTPLAQVMPDGEPLASASCNGVTVTLDAVIYGGPQLVSYVFGVARDDGQPFDEANVQFGLRSDFLITASEVEKGQPGWLLTSGAGWSTLDLDPTDNKLQISYDARLLEPYDGEILCKFELVDLVVLANVTNAQADPWNVVHSGTWRLEYAYTPAALDLARTAAVDRTLEINGTAVHVTSVSIMPTGLSVALEHFCEPLSAEERATNEHLAFMPVSVTLKDGTSVTRSAPSNGGGTRWAGATTESPYHFIGSVDITFTQVIDPNEVVEVTLDGIGIPLEQ